MSRLPQTAGLAIIKDSKLVSSLEATGKNPKAQSPQFEKTLGLGFRVQGSGLRVEALGFRVWGLGFRV